MADYSVLYYPIPEAKIPKPVFKFLKRHGLIDHTPRDNGARLTCKAALTEAL